MTTRRVCPKGMGPDYGIYLELEDEQRASCRTVLDPSSGIRVCAL